jgi:hypothetical protein
LGGRLRRSLLREVFAHPYFYVECILPHMKHGRAEPACMTPLMSMATSSSARFQNGNRDRATPVESVSGLPYSDEQKKTRLRSHLSA